jgi:CheY-like chemotaxis protein
MPPRDDAKPTVLVVDDDRANLQTFRIVFRDAYTITLAASGDEALRAVEAAPFDVALVDFAMPGMNGLEVLCRIRAERPAIRRAVVSGYPDLPEIVAASASGLAEAVLMKPWDRAVLQATLDALVRARAPNGSARGPSRGG